MYLLEHVLLVISRECFLTCVDDSASVDDEVRSVQDAACLESFACSVIINNVVGSSGNSSALELRDGLAVYDSAESARCEDVAFNAVDLVFRDLGCSELLNSILHCFAVRVVAYDQLCACFVQKLCQAHAYLAESLYSDLHSVKAVGTVHELCNSADTVKYADGCEWRRVAGYVCTAYYIICSAQHVISILCIGIDILSGVVLAHESVYCFAECFEHSLCLLGWVCNDNALGSSERHSCSSVLVAHAA